MPYSISRFKKVEKIDISNEKSIKDVFVSSPLNCVVEKSFIRNNSTGIDIPNACAVYNSKTGKHFGITTPKYGIVQNDIVFSLFETMLSELKLKPKSINIVNDGEEYILTAGVNTLLKINKKEEDVAKEIIVRNGHNGKIGLSATLNVVRLICTNGMVGLVPDKKNSFNIRHTLAVNGRFNDIIKNMTVLEDAYVKYVENVKELSNIRITAQQIEEFLIECVSKKSANERDKVEMLIKNGKGNDGKTALDIINGYYEYLDHSDKSDDYNGLFGPDAGKKVKAYNWIKKNVLV
ncbi:MAG: DUF932 domain-containing protein [bacterium]